jgi:ketosteroid isomerase-like protein
MSNVHVIRPGEEARRAQSFASPVERVYFEWNEALSRNDVNGLLELYAPDGVIESPLIPHVMGISRGICRGRGEMRPFFEEVARRKPPVRQYYRTGYLTDGKRLVFEYPREAPEGEQMDFVESMVLNDAGLIQRHCVYWGWYGFGVLQRNEYRR